MLVYGFFGMGKTTAAKALCARGIYAADVDEELFLPRREDFPAAAAAEAAVPGRIVFVNGSPPSVKLLRPAIAFLPETIEDACVRLRRRGVNPLFTERLLRRKNEIEAWFRAAPFGRTVRLKPGEFILDHAGMLLKEAAAEAERAGRTIAGTAETAPHVPQTEGAALAAVRTDGRNLRFVPERLRTEEVCLAAVLQTEDAMQWVPEAVKTQEFCAEAIGLAGAAEAPAFFRA